MTQRMVEHASGRAGHSEPGDFKLSLSGCHDTTIAATLAALGAFDVAKDQWPNYTSNIALELFRRKDTQSPLSTPASTTGAMWPSREKTWWFSLFSPSTPPASSRTPLSELSPTDRSKLDDYFVRLRYNDRPLTLPYCQQAGRHLEGDESFCTLTAFKEAADSFTPRNWRDECGKRLGEPVMGAGVERPPGVV